MNDFVVKPLKNKKADLVSAFPKLFKNPYGNCVIVGGKCSGKSTNVARIVENVVSKGMNVIIFAGSLHSDDVYKDIQEILKKKKANVMVFDHFMDFENDICRLEEIIHDIEKSNIEEEEIDTEPIEALPVNFGDKKKRKERKKKKKKEKTKNLRPETLIILDDLSSDLSKQNIMYKCLNRNRHNKIMSIVVCHSCVDLKPGAFNQADYMLLYPQLPYDKIIGIQDKIGLSSNECTAKDNILLNKYKEATQGGKSKYDFLYVDKKDNSFRRNYNEPI